jgi:hypothetical protein
MEPCGRAVKRAAQWTGVRSPVARVLSAMLLAAAGGVSDGRAAEWSVAPTLSAKGEYNSNLLLFNGNNEVWGAWVTPALTFKGATETLEVEGGVRADFIRYHGESDRELTNIFFPVKASYRRDRMTFGFDGGFTRDNTLMGELRQTGLVLAFTQRNLATAAPTATVGITERLSWHTGYQFTDARYQDGLRFGLVDYRVHGGTTGLHYNAGELDRIHVTGEYASVAMPSIAQRSTYYGAQAGWTRDFGNETTGSLSGGVRVITATQDFAGGSLSDDQLVGLYRVSLAKRFERTTVELDAGREVNPSGFGLLLQTDRYGGTITHGFSETLSIGLSGGLYAVSGVATAGFSRGVPRSRFLSISPSLSWKFAQWWTLDAAYTYQERAIGSLNQWNLSNSMFVMVTYGGAKWSVSR